MFAIKKRKAIRKTRTRGHITSLAVVLAWCAAPVWSDLTQCAGTDVTVSSTNAEYAALSCDAVIRADQLFARCGVPSRSSPTYIEVVPDLKDGCVALYHCGEGLIEILEPPLMNPRREPDGAFSFLANDDYFQSVIVHEMAHVAFDSAPCPFTTCLTSNEYVAYGMQVMSLPLAAQTEFAARSGLDRKVSRDELSAVILLMAPGRFAQKAWAHLSQQSDPCAYVVQIFDGTVLLDRERF